MDPNFKRTLIASKNLHFFKNQISGVEVDYRIVKKTAHLPKKAIALFLIFCFFTTNR